jgi:hypothetical protein
VDSKQLLVVLDSLRAIECQLQVIGNGSDASSMVEEEEDDDDASEQMLDEEEHTVMVKQHDEQLIGLTEKTGWLFHGCQGRSTNPQQDAGQASPTQCANSSFAFCSWCSLFSTD